MFDLFFVRFNILLYLIDPKIREKRKKFGGNKKKNYTEGWIEFTDKRIAKLVALTLNNQQIGGGKRNYYHEDIWNIKYLSKFKWQHLTERISYEKAVHDQKLRADITHATRENAQYIRNVEKSKMMRDLDERRRRKLEREDSNMQSQNH